jgi:gluconolactonase
MNMTRRGLFATAGAAATAMALPRRAGAQSFEFKPNQRYPDASVEILDPSFARHRLFSSSVEQLASGMRWAEGPVWFGDGRYVQFRQRQCARPPRPADQLRTSDPPRHPDRI